MKSESNISVTLLFVIRQERFFPSIITDIISSVYFEKVTRLKINHWNYLVNDC